MRYSIPAALCGFLALTACGGSSVDNDSYASRFAEGEALVRLLNEQTGQNYSDPANLPTSGGAEYDGVVAAELPGVGSETTTVVGDLELRANFANSTVGGTMDDFVEEDGTRYTGALIVADGPIRRNINPDVDYTFSSAVNGRLAGNNQTYDVNGQLEGDFYGANQGFVGGEVIGNVTSNGQRAPFLGEFVGRR
ncbi:hypothetical protein [Oceaniglobus indicus]|uniref:hypothetical protein n=1 Tax=Oceaniglobus indicus TaxID=2047749 RepID=UPI000C17AD3F|nr:hypothetical protein [Oceaniglobus indicus]